MHSKNEAACAPTIKKVNSTRQDVVKVVQVGAEITEFTFSYTKAMISFSEFNIS